MRGASQSRNPESQPVRFLGKLFKMRSAVGLSKQEGLHGRESPHGSRTSLGQDCPGEPSGGHTPTVVHREGRDGEGHGGQGQDASTGFDTKDGHQPDLCPVQGAIGEDGFHGERSATRALEDAGEINHTRSDHHGRGCGEEHPEDGEAGADRGELRPEAAIEEGRGESREVEGHGADSQGQVTGQAKDTSEGCEEDQEGGGVGIKLGLQEKKVYWCRFHGCAYGLEYRGLPVQKSWTVLTTNRHIWMALQKKCPGHPEHIHCRGEAAKASSYYPMKMVKAVTRGLVDTWTSHEKCCGVSLAEDVEQYLLEIPKEAEDGKEAEECCKGAREDDPHVLALTRDRFTSEPPKGKKLEQIKQQMMRIHRASGHSSFANLQ